MPSGSLCVYAYLDQPVDTLVPADRLLLDGLRCWALARALGRDTLEAITARAPALIASAESLDDAMTLLDDAGTTPLTLQRPCHDSVEEDEAVLLAIAALAQDGDVAAASTALSHLADPAAAKPIALLLADAARRLGEATMVVRR